MHSCPPRAMFEQFLARELDADSSQAFDDHLAACPACRSSLHALTDDPQEQQWRAVCDVDADEPFQSDTWLGDGLYDRMQQAMSGEESTQSISWLTDEKELPVLPGYEMLKLLAQGGMAVVYQARQLRPNRLVAIKFISASAGDQKRPTDRLIAEADALARLNHPNIVEIYEVGHHKDQPYLVLEYLDGGTLEDAVRGDPVPFARAALVVETVAEAMKSAHQAGLVHRDLKPSNILLTADGNPKIADFGLVKHLASPDGLTTAGAVLGTPSYMAPEQAGSRLGEITAATDVYALGAILYALLTGRPPFKSASPMETVLQVLHEEPPSPSLLRREIPRDLQTICLHCLEKDPRRRYAGADDLAADLRCFRQGESISVRPVGALGRTAKWARRRPAVAALLAAVVLVTSVGLTLTTWLWDRAERRAIQEHLAKEDARDSEHREKAARQQVERLSVSLALDQAQSLCDKGDLNRGLMAFVGALELSVQAKASDLERAARIQLAAWRPHFISRLMLCKHPSWVLDASFSPDEKQLLTICYDHKVRRWNMATGQLIGEPLSHSEVVNTGIFNPDGSEILTGSGPEDDRSGELSFWDAATGKLLVRLPFPSTVKAISFSPDGTRFLTVCTHQAQVWNRDHTPLGPSLRHPNAGITVAAFSPDGRTVATGGSDGDIRFWDATDGKSIGKRLHQEKGVLALAFHPAGKLLAAASEKESTVQLWDITSGRMVGTPLMHGGPIKALTFSPDGKRLATGSLIAALDPVNQKIIPVGGEAHLWDAATGKSLGVPLLHPRPVWSLAFSPKSERLLTGCEDGIARLYSCVNGQQIGNALLASGTVMRVAFNRNGQTAVTAAAGSSARLWDLRAITGLGRSIIDDQSVSCLAFSEGGDQLAAGCEDGVARIIDMKTGKVSDLAFRHGGVIRTVAFSTKGDRLMTGGEDKRARLWDYPSGKLLNDIGFDKPVTRIAALADGRGFLIGRLGGVIRWDNDGKPAGSPLDTEGARVVGLVASPEGRTFWMASDRPVVSCYDLLDGSLVKRVEYRGAPPLMALSADGSILLVGDHLEGVARIYDVDSGNPKGPPLLMQSRGLIAASFSPDAKTLIICGEHEAQLWDMATGKPVGPILPEPRCLSGAFSPTGLSVITAGKNGARIWPVPEPISGPVEIVKQQFEALTGSSLASPASRTAAESAVVKESP